MTPVPPSASLFDTGNMLLAPVPIRLEAGTLDTPAGKLAVITLRSATTTMTGMLQGADLRNWSKVLSDLADSMDGSKVVPATALDVAALNAGSVRLARRR